MRLSVKAMTYTWGLIGSGAVLLVGLLNLAAPSYGKAFLEICSSIYPGYHVTGTITSVIIGTLYASFDGAIGGAIFAWLYNRLLQA